MRRQVTPSATTSGPAQIKMLWFDALTFADSNTNTPNHTTAVAQKMERQMSDYTPTTEEVRLDYAPAKTFPADAEEQFDRWLAEVKATEREDCVNHVKFLYCSHSMEHKPYQEAVDDIVEVLTGKEDGSEVFEKWLAEVKAEAVIDLVARIEAAVILLGDDDITPTGRRMISKVLNPYRQENHATDSN